MKALTPAPGPTSILVFPCRNARSPSLPLGLSLAIVVETVAVHLWLVPRYPIVAWTLSALSLLSLLWLVGDYRAQGRARVLVDQDMLRVRVGWRATADIPTDAVQSVVKPTWRDIPESGHDQGYLNPMAPADPNVLLTFAHSVQVRLMQSVHVPATQLGLTLDKPDEFVAAMRRAMPSAMPRAK